MSLTASEVLFLTVQKKQVMTSPLFWTWDLSLNRNYLFFEKILHVTKAHLVRGGDGGGGGGGGGGGSWVLDPFPFLIQSKLCSQILKPI